MEINDLACRHVVKILNACKLLKTLKERFIELFIITVLLIKVISLLIKGTNVENFVIDVGIGHCQLKILVLVAFIVKSKLKLQYEIFHKNHKLPTVNQGDFDHF